MEESTKPRAKCNYCGGDYACDPKLNGTTAMLAHLESKCKKYPYRNQDKSQSTLGFQHTTKEGDSVGQLVPILFRVDACRSALVEMVIMDELSFRFVEGEGFCRFMHVVQPKWVKIPSRVTVAKDCFNVYVKEKSKLKSAIRGQRICLTTDTWTSLQNLNYMCLTAHFIDSDWKLHKRILSFCLVESHKGEALGKKVEMCLKLEFVFIEYCTSNSFFMEFVLIKNAIQQLVENEDLFLHSMALEMKNKFDKYWGNFEKMNMILFVAVVLDPRYKLKCVKYWLGRFYDNMMTKELTKKVKGTLVKLYDWYIANDASTIVQERYVSSSSQQVMNVDVDQDARELLKYQFEKHLEDEDGGTSKSEVEIFLCESCEKDSKAFDILGWWRNNSGRYRILSQVACVVLAVPVSSVASESAFSTGGRILYPFCSNLSPTMVEALICAQNWLRSSSAPISIREAMDYVEEIEKLELEITELMESRLLEDHKLASCNID